MKKYELALWVVLVITAFVIILSGNPWFIGLALLATSILWILDSAFSGTVDPIIEEEHGD